MILRNCQDPMTAFSFDGTMFAMFFWEQKWNKDMGEVIMDEDMD